MTSSRNNATTEKTRNVERNVFVPFTL